MEAKKDIEIYECCQDVINSAVELLKQAQHVFGSDTSNQYNTGFYNGMELCIATLEQRDPVLLEDDISKFHRLVSESKSKEIE